MNVIRSGEMPKEKLTGSLFTGPVTATSVCGDEKGQFSLAYIAFPAGVRNKLHTHTTDQVLIVTEGTGIVATEREEFMVETGDAVLIPAGERHRHGAAATTPMTHLVITGADSQLEQLEQ
jgi:quercetin dioxygenase-like cupin family protein